MYPVLYSSDLVSNKNFTRYGLGVLKDCESCHVVEERNGEYYLELSYPVGGASWDQIETGNLIKAIPAEDAEEQLFRIISVRPSLGGRIAVTAEHVSKQAKYMIVKPFSGTYTASAFAAALGSHLAEIDDIGGVQYDNPISVICVGSSDSASVAYTVPRTLHDALMGTAGAMTDVWGVEYSYEDYGYTIKAHTAASPRGKTLPYGIRYGQNMTSLEIERAIRDRYSAIYGYYYDENSKTYVDSGRAYGAHSYIPGYIPRVKIVDFSTDFQGETAPTQADLQAKAKAYAAANAAAGVDFSAKISFAPAWQSKEAVQLPAQVISLCDTVPVVYEKLGVTLSAKVIKTDFNVLTERYNSIEVGTAKKPLGKILAQTAKGAGVSVYT